MARFIYKAKKGPGEVVEGIIEADSEKGAINKLMADDYYPVWIEEASSIRDASFKEAFFFHKRIRVKDIANFTRQLSELLESGLPLYNSLNIIESQITLPQLKVVIGNLKDSIKDGNNFSESLRMYPYLFSDLYIGLVRAGETGGVLNEALNSISDFLEKQEDIRSKIIVALSYPALMVLVGGATIFILVGFVIPKLVNMFTEMGEVLPLPTRMLIGVSNFIRLYWILLVIFVGGIIFFIKKNKSNKVVKKAMDNFKLKIPTIGTLVKNTELARFARTLSTLLKNGVPILTALKITTDVIDSEVIKEQVKNIHADVQVGASLTIAIKKRSFFPPFLINMVAVGEEGGSLDKMLLKVAQNYEVENDRTIKILSNLLEPVIILIMGIVVGFIVISMLLPVFQISLTAK